MNIYFELMLAFAKVGVCTFGGGYAMLPVLEREIVDKRGWMEEAELNDCFAISQCTPGAIAVNTATFVGRKVGGNLGGILATVGVVCPSVVIITVIAAFLNNFAENPYVIHAFNGVRACVCVLIFNAVVRLQKSSVIDKPAMVIFLVVFLISAIWGVSPAAIVVVAGIIGLAIRLAREGRGA